MTEARAIHGDDTISLGQRRKYPADLKILQHGAVAVQQDERRSLASLEIMEVDPFNIEEVAGRWVVPLRSPGAAERLAERWFLGGPRRLDQPRRALLAASYSFSIENGVS
jgi:hypothetical protein